MILSKKIITFLKLFSSFFPLFLITIFFTSCLTDHQGKIKPIRAGEDSSRKLRIHEIRERGKLIATTNYNSTDYFIYRGEPMGYQYEKLKMFADYLDVELEIKVALNLDEAFTSLEEGKADVIAMGLAQTRDRVEKYDFSSPIFQTRQMLVQRKPDNWRKMRTWDDIEKSLIRNPLDLAGKTVIVQKSSAYAGRLENLSEEIGAPINVQVDPLMEAEQLVEAVAKGEIDFTVCDEHMAAFFERQHSELDIRTPISFPQNIGWVVRHDSDSLLAAINDWLGESESTLASRHLMDKYFNNPRASFMARSEKINMGGKQISEYDEILRNISRQHDFDWRLVASLVYQESQFQPEVKSWAGAFGLMQLMPATAKLFGIDSTASEFQQIEAGVMFMKKIDDELPRDIKDRSERIKFILAAYNVGIAHVMDARRLAEKHGKDPNVWTGNVDYYILNKSNPKYYRDSVVRYGYARGEETYQFVNEVLDRFEHYKNYVGD
ncbi:MAG TPA: transporter substrate-binding domain-containing protein [Bacteroidales bacterium]|nr:transporter substrate-binding domain-containing protein [Bacteroidales bacterium]HOX78747.1 transporter substrate-binding domain-containing protein [Bacteroidales bacterium]HPI86981.1 transporter substrate-binding domain-containing protein [Bacteroidales bacterium]HPM93527.1 transporter substrate-binding domain-containing protein [Bacteroidales bacterium]